MTSCPVKTALINNLACVPCVPEDCLKCNSDVNKCDTCDDTFYVSVDKLSCVNFCNSNEYIQDLLYCKSCTVAMPNCIRCDVFSICL